MNRLFTFLLFFCALQCSVEAACGIGICNSCWTDWRTKDDLGSNGVTCFRTRKRHCQDRMETKHCTPECKTTPYWWQSSTGHTCEDYEANQWCANGGYGSGWLSSFGTFDQWRNDYTGTDASQACCACGGGAAENYGCCNQFNLISEDHETQSLHFSQTTPIAAIVGTASIIGGLVFVVLLRKRKIGSTALELKEELNQLAPAAQL
eukprot:TRINITY_DN1793_c0_g1_i1.p1 TRINITY_DN1793_c0_g1~~TRINITY_DN1793_c0_g1_i1.p1  ORF type:complete len:224 (+),score=52.76 TRINITY_DN1793_c0_g1_i1:56-673(+)